MNNYKINVSDYMAEVLEKLYKNSDKDGKGRMFVQEISWLTGFSIPVVKSVMVLLLESKGLEIASTHDIDNLDKMISFRILSNRLKDIWRCYHV